MYKDFNGVTVHVNRYHTNNFGFGFDYYQLNDLQTKKLEASVLQLSFIFFNITLTRWHKCL